MPLTEDEARRLKRLIDQMTESDSDDSDDVPDEAWFGADGPLNRSKPKHERGPESDSAQNGENTR